VLISGEVRPLRPLGGGERECPRCLSPPLAGRGGEGAKTASVGGKGGGVAAAAAAALPLRLKLMLKPKRLKLRPPSVGEAAEAAAAAAAAAVVAGGVCTGAVRETGGVGAGEPGKWPSASTPKA